MTKIKMFSLSLVAFAIISCGGDTTETNTKTVGKNSNVAPGLESNTSSESSSAKDNIFRLNFSDPLHLTQLSLLILLQLQLLLKFFQD